MTLQGELSVNWEILLKGETQKILQTDTGEAAARNHGILHFVFPTIGVLFCSNYWCKYFEQGFYKFLKYFMMWYECKTETVSRRSQCGIVVGNFKTPSQSEKEIFWFWHIFLTSQKNKKYLKNEGKEKKRLTNFML